MLNVLGIRQKQNYEALLRKDLQLASLFPELRIYPAPHKLPHGTHQPRIGTVTHNERVNDLFSEDRQRDLRCPLGREPGAQPLVLPIEWSAP
jgi:hypothetical protein